MNDEYLWQKTGKDDEIEDLENVLAVFRYREDREPAVKASVAVVARPGWRISWPFAFAATAAAAAISIVALMWFQVSDAGIRHSDVPEVVFVNGPENPSTIPSAEPQQTIPSVQPGAPSQRRNVSGPDKISATTASVRRRAKAKDATVRQSVAALTDEERFAYRQLMLALSISSSKLKIVKNTIDGTEDNQIPVSTNQR